MYFESHAHYNDKRFKDDFDEIIESLKENKVTYVINIGASMNSTKAVIQLSNKYDFFYATVGVHPHSVENLTEDDIDKLKSYYLNNKKVVAVGEIGLDFYYEYSSRDSQRKWFKRQLALANELDLPVVIHSRDADQEAFDIIKEANVNKKGVIHCYSGSMELAREYVKLGYTIGVGGVVTFDNAKKLVETVKYIDMKDILIETDCPYLAPVPNRGKRNDSTNLKYIVDKIASIKGISHEEVCRVSMENGFRVFGIK